MNIAVSPGLETVPAASSGGASVILRRLTHDDASAVADLHAGLPDLDRYRRFFSTHPVDTAALAESLTVQSTLRETVGAFEHGQLIGVANYVGRGSAHSAEIAIVVAHARQLRGVGTMLLKYLAELALRKGISQFTADFLADNYPILNMLKDLAPGQAVDHTGRDVLHISIDLNTISFD
ncbi:N-acetyltransferase GCN5 [Mycobacteroides abscessus subsp. bolletii]|uniref:GNAT family N-acetyltransferase n=1 Tax=Mycobacteroides abscessus TaxID=36809 RepID=UPI0009A86A72|nr:GNAT family N-acetyltransferase [Mycobacteroides abscessus]SKH37825.1 N-acetyltransferase GCN5 [Mycobacteroides abscessus subsp. bolletii]SKU98859.1 N-acetyltransferase GCN5 [Mycobacteroides abscessus subsp. bolletii]